jgi:ComF family protein
MFSALPSLRLRPPALPGCCPVCQDWGDGQLCAPCVHRFAAVVPRCHRCALALPAGQALCGECLREPPPFAHCVCLADSAFPWDRLITRFKFHQSPELALLLADTLAAAARQQHAPLPQAFVPVPLSDLRLAERGYDQAWALARRLGHALGVPAEARLLQRRFDARHQVQLSRRERLANLRGAFAVPSAKLARVQGRHLALVDDVMTTGATAQEAARTLLQAGAARVDLWIVARTAPTHD